MEIIYLLCSILAASITTAILSLRLALQSLVLALLPGCGSSNQGNKDGVVLYQGLVRHVRRRPVFHSFEYPVRYALVDLDQAPAARTLPDSFFVTHLSAGEARRIAHTSGSVLLLTIPPSVGYEQNPLSVYYCYNLEGSTSYLAKCIAEVTNSPWGERVTFPFDPDSDVVPKSLHVSPFMDMHGKWKMHANTPGEDLLLDISVQHPDLGNYFVASLKAKKVCHLQTHSLALFFWFMPQKVALWIYWQALKLWCKKVAFVSHPKYQTPKYREEVLTRNQSLQCPFSEKNGIEQPAAVSKRSTGDGRCFVWTNASWPWC
ncbi:hypothetical protein H6P81_019504 [Aristolochia fimbriata]|uniref:DUF1365 domain-containing protein n=1 Tax=Aristolochia fimbriata TaxID=158543 RepID=A0AAV7DS52_ARIFI|nr:hypothetical protein H6P81_019504 [Aristolochia fimbriata]